MTSTDAGWVGAVLLRAAPDRDRTRADHRALAVSVEESARDAAACVAAGAPAIHLRMGDAEGRERLDSDVADAVVSTVRAAEVVGLVDDIHGTLDRF